MCKQIFFKDETPDTIVKKWLKRLTAFLKTENELVTTNQNRFAIHPLANQNKSISQVTWATKKVNKSQKSKKKSWKSRKSLKLDFLSVKFLFTVVVFK